MHPPVKIFDPARDADNALAAVTGLGPDRAALAAAMHDPVRDAAQRNDRAGMERRGLRQTSETGGDPAAVALGEILGIHQRAARRQGQDGFAIARMNSQGIAPRPAMTSQADRIDLRAMLHQEPGRFGGTSIEECAGHVSKSGGGGIARILPYPPPVKPLGAKTNHLPNIQGDRPPPPPPSGPRNKIFVPNWT